MSNSYEVIVTREGAPMKVLVHNVNELRMHWHEFLEIIFVLDGSINLRVEDKVYVLNEGDVFVVNSREVHSTNKNSGDNIVLVLQIHPDYYSYFYPGFSNIRFNCNSIKATLEEEKKFDILRNSLAQIVWQLNKKVEGYKFMIANELNFIAGYLINNCDYTLIEDENNIILDRDIKRLEEILNYINENIERKLTLKEVAENVNISPYYLSHFFRRKVGLSFQEYLNVVRLDKAVVELYTTDLTITEIAFQNGFSSTNYFNKIFREAYNCTPTEFREDNFVADYEDKSTSENHKKTKSYLDVDRSEAFKRLFKYLIPTQDALKNKTSYMANSLKENIFIDIKDSKEKTYKPHWQNLITFGRAAEGLRSNVQKQFRELQKEIPFKYVRFHGVFMDEMMIYHLNNKGEVSYNWTYIDELFDCFMEINIKPFIELGFMPSELKRSDETVFWWKGNISPPKDMKLWTDLVQAFIKHIINRYGLAEVSSWYFEVWNEPELQYVFWAGTKEEYFKFFKETVLAIKSISKDLKVGGPGTTHGSIINSTWLVDFLNYTKINDIPLDFISTHIYPEYIPEEELNKVNNFIMEDKCKVESLEIKRIYHNENHTSHTIKRINKKTKEILGFNPELHITEWNASSQLGNLIHDTAYVATYIVKNVLESIGRVDSLGYWVFTDIFEEEKLRSSHFHGGFGLVNKDGLKKASYYAYYLLNKLGTTIIKQDKDHIITRSGEDIQILVYNFAYFDDLFLKGDISAINHKIRYDIYQEKPLKELELIIKGLSGNYKITRYELNKDQGSVFDQWLKMGAPENMTQEEIEYLKGISKPKITIQDRIIEEDYHINSRIPVHGVELITMEKKI